MTLPSRNTGTPAARTSADPDLGGDELQRGRDLPVEELRQRQHEDEVQHRRPEHQAAPRPEAGEHQPEHPDDQRVEGEVVDLHQVADERHHQRQPDHRHPRPAVAGRHARRAGAAPPSSRAGTCRTRGPGSPARGCTRAGSRPRRARSGRSRTAAGWRAPRRPARRRRPGSTPPPPRAPPSGSRPPSRPSCLLPAAGLAGRIGEAAAEFERGRPPGVNRRPGRGARGGGLWPAAGGW